MVAKPSLWQHFPLAVTLSMLLVVAVNVGMIWSALSSFPGAVDDHAFDTGNDYNRVLETAAQQAALGWKLDVTLDGREPEARLVDRSGAPLARVDLRAVAAHPVGPANPVVLEFVASGDRYVARAPLPSDGQWDLELTATANGAVYRATRRVIAP